MLAAVAVNDTVALIGLPIAILIGKIANIDPRAMAILLMFSLTIGSALTPIGNPQNILIVVNSGMLAPIIRFIARPFIPTMLNLFLTTIIIRKYYGIEGDEIRVGLIPQEAIGLAVTIAALIINDLFQLMGLPYTEKRGFIPFIIAAGVYPLASSPQEAPI